jgi:hypothetical protein
MKRFLSYLIFRIVLHGIKISRFDKGLKSNYYYMLGVISLFPSVILAVYFKRITGYDLIGQFDSKIVKWIITFFTFNLPIMYLFSLLIPHKYVKSLEYTLEERKKYRNVFLVLLLLFVSLFVYLMAKNWVNVPLNKQK